MLVCRYPLSHWSLSAWFSLDWTTFFSSLNFAVFVFLTLQPGELQPTLRKRRKFSLLDNLRVGWVEGREKERLQVKWWRTTTRQEKRLVWAFLSRWMERKSERMMMACTTNSSKKFCRWKQLQERMEREIGHFVALQQSSTTTFSPVRCCPVGQDRTHQTPRGEKSCVLLILPRGQVVLERGVNILAERSQNSSPLLLWW